METVTLYTRGGCGLCDEMKADLTRRGYLVRAVDIDQDEELTRQYGWEIGPAYRHDLTTAASHSSYPPSEKP